MSPILTSKHVTCNFLFFCWYFSLDSQERKSLYIWPSPSSLPRFLNTLANFCQLRRKCIRLKVAVTTVLWVLLAVRSKVQLFDYPYCLSLGARSWIVRAPPWKCWRKLVRGDCISICFFQRIFPISPDSSTPKSVPARAAHVFQLLSIQQGNPTSEWPWDALHASPWQIGQLYCHTRSSMPDKRDVLPGGIVPHLHVHGSMEQRHPNGPALPKGSLCQCGSGPNRALSLQPYGPCSNTTERTSQGTSAIQLPNELTGK